jgi:hypothetical protein
MNEIQLKHASFIVSHFDKTRFPSSAQVTRRIEFLGDKKNLAAPIVAAILWQMNQGSSFFLN